MKAERDRLREREDEVMNMLVGSQTLDERRVFAHRMIKLGRAGTYLVTGRPGTLVYRWLDDYSGIVREARRATSAALTADTRTTLQDLPGYRADGGWVCEDCGYPFYEGSGWAFTCASCGEADRLKRQLREELRRDVANRSTSSHC